MCAAELKVKSIYEIMMMMVLVSSMFICTRIINETRYWMVGE